MKKFLASLLALTVLCSSASVFCSADENGGSQNGAETAESIIESAGDERGKGPEKEDKESERD